MIQFLIFHDPPDAHCCTECWMSKMRPFNVNFVGHKEETFNIKKVEFSFSYWKRIGLQYFGKEGRIFLHKMLVALSSSKLDSV